MKRITVILLAFSLIGIGYLFYRKKNSLIYRYDHLEVSDYTERVRLEKELDSIKAAVDSARYDHRLPSIIAPEDHSKCLSTADGLRKQNDALRAENEELKGRLKAAIAARATAPSTQTPQKTQRKNEKTLPIARNSRAVELQRFLTELYGDR